MSPGLGLADPPFGTTEPGLRRFPPPGLSANAWDVTRGGCPRSEVRPLASRELALSALWRLEFGEALSASLSRCRSRAVIFRQPTRQPPRQPCALGRRVYGARSLVRSAALCARQPCAPWLFWLALVLTALESLSWLTLDTERPVVL